jgi:hypothetical protein
MRFIAPPLYRIAQWQTKPQGRTCATTLAVNILVEADQMDLNASEEQIEIFGRSASSVVAAFKYFQDVPERLFLENGIGELLGDAIVIEPDRWYPQENWMRAFRAIAGRVGDATLFHIGSRVPASAPFPSGIVDVEGALQAIDVAYHLCHRKGGRVMYDEASGTMLEGIGHYGARPSGPHEVTCVCDNPYPCAFDQGLVTAMARKYERHATISHEPETPCRKLGADTCVYVVRW